MSLGSRKLAAILAASALAAGIGAGAATGAKRHAPGVLLNAAAQYLQLDRAALVKDVRGGQTLAQIATARGKSVEGLEAAMVAAAKTKLDAAVRAGNITAARLETRLARVQKLVDRLVNARLAGRIRHAGRARVLGIAAKYVGITPKALAGELKGRSLAQVATAHGKTVAGLKDALLKPLKAPLDKAVASGRITSVDVQSKLAKVSARLDELINKTR